MNKASRIQILRLAYHSTYGMVPNTKKVEAELGTEYFKKLQEILEDDSEAHI